MIRYVHLFVKRDCVFVFVFYFQFSQRVFSDLLSAVSSPCLPSIVLTFFWGGLTPAGVISGIFVGQAFALTVWGLFEANYLGSKFPASGVAASKDNLYLY